VFMVGDKCTYINVFTIVHTSRKKNKNIKK
jgi:hypothetical protein